MQVGSSCCRCRACAPRPDSCQQDTHTDNRTTLAGMWCDIRNLHLWCHCVVKHCSLAYSSWFTLEFLHVSTYVSVAGTYSMMCKCNSMHVLLLSIPKCYHMSCFMDPHTYVVHTCDDAHYCPVGTTFFRALRNLMYILTIRHAQYYFQ